MSSNKTKKEEEALEKAFSSLVNRLIDKNYESSKEKISQQMAPLIGGAIRQQIKSQKDDIVDALYPVVGNMISRYVTKMFEDMLTNINNQVQNGLSFKTLKRKLTAKIKGVNESELLFNESATANIQALLLVHKETGIVLAHVENPDYPVSEPEMLASMMTAIRSFVNDWIEKNGDADELGEIEYGDKKIILESGGYSYLAVILQGNPNKLVYDKIRETLENIVLNHGEEIKNFNGNLENFENISLYKNISQLLSSNEDEIKHKKVHPLLFIFPILALFFTGFYIYKIHLDTELIQKVDTKLYKTPSLSLFRLNSSADDGVVTIKGEVPFAYHKDLAQKTLNGIDGIKEIKNEIVVIDTLKDPMQLSANIAYLLKGFNLQNGVNVTYTFDFNTLTLKGNVYNTKLKQTLLKQLKAISSIKNIDDKLVVIPPKIDTKIYFEKGSTSLNSASQAKLIELLTVLKDVDSSYSLSLTSYSDQVGSTQRNRKLSQQRLTSISNFLKDQGKVKNELTFIIKDTPPDSVDVTMQPNEARVISIKYTNMDN